MNVGERIKKLRKDKDLTLEELANIFNNKYNSKVTKQFLSMLENGRRQLSINMATKYVEYFNTSYDYILLGRN